jgi:predicted RND superfamily exporter protein
MLPPTDSTIINYEKFKSTFGEDGAVMFVGVKSPEVFELEMFNDWYDLTDSVRSKFGVQEVLSIARLYQLERNDSIKKFDFKPILKRKPQSQAELDSVLKITYNQPLYDELLFNRKNNSTLLMITLDKEYIASAGREAVVTSITDACKAFEEKHDIELHYSGLPYIRTITTTLVQDELRLFIWLAMAIASIALFIFFRSFKAVIIPMAIVGISVIWVFGTNALMGYKITILSGILPPLLIIIGVENCIFLLNKFHHEYKSHGNKIRALSRTVQKVGNATFLTNLTTATGFAAFIVTGNKVLMEFGIIASINILAIFFLSIFLVPIIYSFMKPPEEKHTKHLENKFTSTIINQIIHIVTKHRTSVYLVAFFSIIIAAIGISKLETTGRMVDDLSKDSKTYQDIIFMEEQVNGILPMEIVIDTKKPNGVLRTATLKRINRLQDSLAKFPELSKPLSVAEVAKVARMSFYNGNPKYYSLPNNQEKNFILSYVPLDQHGNNRSIINSFVDSSLSKTRISVQMANIGTSRMQEIKDELVPMIDEIFNPKRYDVTITGSSVVFLKGTGYLLKNLAQSLLLAIFIIACLMALLFTSGKMIAVSLTPNIFPLLLTAALMGFAEIPIKPTTILIFSIALGISVDNAIHFLSRYRMELKLNNWEIKKSVINALKETSFSMIYSSIVLFFGFAIFTQSTFGGTEAMGYLVSFTLVVAVLSNLFVLPSLLLSLDRRITTKSFKEPLIHVFDEEDDIELDELEIEKRDGSSE